MTMTNDPNRFALRSVPTPQPKVPPTVIGPDTAAAFWLATLGPVPMTVWHNPTNNDGHVDLNVDAGRAYVVHPGAPPMMVRVSIPRGGKCQIPSVFDRAIHRVHNGHVVGGLAPAWRCAGSFPTDPILVDETHAPYTGPEAA